MNIRQCDCWGNVIGGACLVVVEVDADTRKYTNMCILTGRVSYIIVNKNIPRLKLGFRRAQKGPSFTVICNEGANYM